MARGNQRDKAREKNAKELYVSLVLCPRSSSPFRGHPRPSFKNFTTHD